MLKKIRGQFPPSLISVNCYLQPNAHKLKSYSVVKGSTGIWTHTSGHQILGLPSRTPHCLISSVRENAAKLGICWHDLPSLYPFPAETLFFLNLSGAFPNHGPISLTWYLRQNHWGVLRSGSLRSTPPGPGSWVGRSWASHGFVVLVSRCHTSSCFLTNAPHPPPGLT